MTDLEKRARELAESTLSIITIGATQRDIERAARLTLEALRAVEREAMAEGCLMALDAATDDGLDTEERYCAIHDLAKRIREGEEKTDDSVAFAITRRIDK